ncbi:hypothetical protein M441DRAFT_156141 [Trichoderma asperellum CBS 433.97]|uniref:Uncharacterized protein n=1 Tax=Trichoderma asperellum (strain ATCC 204424 / CBS 433.97 / NBRC 101777) TaxID=1042311 RepID=A0A2T3ZNL4_TRIA4|nr:hypothetical protein M441DRAFT_156141 [Trichoderma asperellum CBS 433.97]PTB46381.1 hypothetical protein M441DRAFT_156141 [Trichoderma asperellum CBS 433.97]
MSSGQIAAPYPIKPSQRANIRLATSEDIYSSLSSSLSPLKGHQRPIIPFDHAPVTKDDSNSPGAAHRVFEDDYTVPAPPPPSPVSFRVDRWPTPACR